MVKKMRMRRVFVLLALGILLLPVISIQGSDSNESMIITPTNLDSDVGVLDGDIFYYNIDKLTLPPEAEIDNVTLPDFSGNQIFVKVCYVEEDYLIDLGVTSTVIHYGIGFKFAKDTTFELDFSLLETDIVIPSGATTPSIQNLGYPHFGDYDYTYPAIFFLNNDWDSHVTALEALGFTVTNEAGELTAILFDEAGVVTLTWRKSDGVLTHLMIEDILFIDTDFTDTTIEISLAQKEARPLNIAAGDQILINLEQLDVEVEVSGEIAEFYDEDEINGEIALLKDLVGSPMIRLIVQDVYGVFYTCSAWVVDDIETGELVKTNDDIYFVGFQGLIIYDYTYLPGFNWEDYTDVGPIYLPAITPDWDIYEGYMVLGDTLLNVYIDTILNTLEIDEEYQTINNIEFSFGFDKKRDYYYYQQSMNEDYENNYYWLDPLSSLGTEDIYTTGSKTQINEQIYVAYHESGIFAGLRVKYDATTTYYDHSGSSAIDTGTYHIEVDVKLQNPDFNPPDNFGGGFIPGFDWLIAIPAITAVTIYSIYLQRRKTRK